MKIGIISLFCMNNVNFGNRLQAYALNRFLRDNFSYNVISLYFTDWGKSITTVKPRLYRILMKKVKKIPGKLMGEGRMTSKVIGRLKKHNEFSKSYMLIPDHPWTWNELTDSDFDLLIVGSDVIWGQSYGVINQRAFLDFDAKKTFKRISYAASFGKDWIPDDNATEIKRCLNKFYAISVREKSSVKLLESIGVKDAEYVCDPTILISAEQWRKVEEKPIDVEGDYIFAYLLGRKRDVREETKKIAHNLGLPIITVPFATGEYNRLDGTFGDKRIMDCGIEEWLWLIDHASFVVTDSFHGTVFANIFKKKYIVLERNYSENINNRMIDFLQTLGQEDKLIQPNGAVAVQSLNWDYNDISNRINLLRCNSIAYLNEAIKVIQ